MPEAIADDDDDNVTSGPVLDNPAPPILLFIAPPVIADVVVCRAVVLASFCNLRSFAIID